MGHFLRNATQKLGCVLLSSVLCSTQVHADSAFSDVTEVCGDAVHDTTAPYILEFENRGWTVITALSDDDADKLDDLTASWLVRPSDELVPSMWTWYRKDDSVDGNSKGLTDLSRDRIAVLQPPDRSNATPLIVEAAYGRDVVICKLASHYSSEQTWVSDYFEPQIGAPDIVEFDHENDTKVMSLMRFFRGKDAVPSSPKVTEIVVHRLSPIAFSNIGDESIDFDIIMIFSARN